jgi:hypothetical protein
LPSTDSSAKKMADRAGIVRLRSLIASKDSSLVQLNCSRSPNRLKLTFHLLKPELLQLRRADDHHDAARLGRRRRISSIISADRVAWSPSSRCRVNVPSFDEAAVDAGDEHRGGGKELPAKLLRKRSQRSRQSL